MSPSPAGDTPFDWQACIQAARAGSAEALGRLLQACRPHLLVIAERELDARLRAKAGPSDIVQESFLDASRAFPRFIGGTEGEVRAWLCRILRNNIADLRDGTGAAKRDVSREESLDQGAADRKEALADDTPSPSSNVRRREEEERVEAALARLSEDHRRVIHLRYREHLPFKEIAKAIGRSVDAVQKLWERAIKQLQTILAEQKR